MLLLPFGETLAGAQDYNSRLVVDGTKTRIRVRCSPNLPRGKRSPVSLLIECRGTVAVAQPIIWKEITTAFEVRMISGSWAVEDGVVRVRTALGPKAAALAEANGVWLAWRRLREMAADGKA